MNTVARALAILLYYLLLTEESSSALAITFDSTEPNFSPVAADGTVGWQFSVTTQIIVGSLGLFDAGAPGLLEDHAVALWTLDQTLVASAVVDNGSVPVDALGGNGRWLFETISQVVLPPGDYVLAAHYITSGANVGDYVAHNIKSNILAPEVPLDVITGPGIEYRGMRFGWDGSSFSTGFVFPSGFNSTHNGSFGPNFQIVPEPQSTALLLLGFLRLFLLRRKN